MSATLEVSGLTTRLPTGEGTLTAVDDVSFTLERGRTLCVVGESGSGKTVMSLSVMGLLPRAEVEGSVRLKGRELLGLSRRALRRIRGREIAMVFQDPMTSLNPVHTVGRQLVEAVRLHSDASMRAARKRAVELLGAVGLPDPKRRLDAYPHEFSGGMQQRVMIAMALINDPDVLIADEPTTALDVTTQAQILTVLARMQRELGTAILLVTHDLGVVANVADHVAVMYAGQVVEQASLEAIFDAPQHPYTWGLLTAIPRPDRSRGRLAQIAGSPPSLVEPQPGCRFCPRCAHAVAACTDTPPPLVTWPADAGSHRHRCLLADETRADVGRRAVEASRGPAG